MSQKKKPFCQTIRVPFPLLWNRQFPASTPSNFSGGLVGPMIHKWPDGGEGPGSVFWLQEKCRLPQVTSVPRQTIADTGEFEEGMLERERNWIARSQFCRMVCKCFSDATRRGVLVVRADDFCVEGKENEKQN
ncbi:hypothetical protein CEXT_461371 [Caerostris extrusa]|uniref:Uncharacterized protein n=1 Tax=Caerostris extrusa TaxID=172846 RepID=A0AAV4XQQ6_CAEEX|nr:hypothetical protein CEXT_461371 [Caerostris extrusa]